MYKAHRGLNMKKMKLKKLILICSILIGQNALADVTNILDPYFVKSVPMVQNKLGANATKLKCSVSDSLLTRTNKILVDIKNSKSYVSSKLLGDSDFEAQCTIMDTQLICYSQGFDVVVEDVNLLKNEQVGSATLRTYGLFSMSSQNINCVLN